MVKIVFVIMKSNHNVAEEDVKQLLPFNVLNDKGLHVEKVVVSEAP
jgi:hypothetical protein